MYKAMVGVAALLTASTLGFAQPKAAVDITKAQIDEVLKQGALRKPPSVDNTLRVIDMGSYALSVAVVHRGPTGQPAGGAGRGAAGNKLGTRAGKISGRKRNQPLARLGVAGGTRWESGSEHAVAARHHLQAERRKFSTGSKMGR